MIDKRFDKVYEMSQPNYMQMLGTHVHIIKFEIYLSDFSICLAEVATGILLAQLCFDYN